MGIAVCYVMHKPLPQLTDAQKERFWVRIEKQGKHKCWLWTGCQDSKGYGMVAISGGVYRTHRIAYFLHYSADPEHLLVCHKCNTPGCCNPYHLYLGTNAENIQDAHNDGLCPREGEHNSRAKLTENQVIVIRKAKGTNVALGKKYGVTDVTISYIRLRRTWKHVA